MWAAADVEQLVRLGKQAWVTVPRPAGGSKEAAAAGAASTAPAPSSSQLPAPSQLPADSKGKQQVKEEPQEQPPAEQQCEEGEQQQQLPAHATSPLAAMHGILCQTAGRLALFSLLLSDARQLEGEGGSWRGRLKLSRAGGGSGIRCEGGRAVGRNLRLASCLGWQGQAVPTHCCCSAAHTP